MGSTTSKPTVAATASSDEKKLLSSFSTLALYSPNYIPESSDGSLTLTNLAAWESAAAADPKTRLARTILSHTNIRAALTSREAYITDRHVFNTELDFKTGPVTNQKSSGRCWLFATTNVLRYDVMKTLRLKEFQLSQVSGVYYSDPTISGCSRAQPWDDSLMESRVGSAISHTAHSKRMCYTRNHSGPNKELDLNFDVTGVSLGSATDFSSQSYLFFFDKLNKANYYLELSLEHANLPLDDRLLNHLSDDLISDGGQWDMVVNILEVRYST